jgi:hypothetical protein
VFGLISDFVLSSALVVDRAMIGMGTFWAVAMFLLPSVLSPEVADLSLLRYAKFFTSYLLSNHIGRTTCVVCGTHEAEFWEYDTAGDPFCSACKPLGSFNISSGTRGEETARRGRRRVDSKMIKEGMLWTRHEAKWGFNSRQYMDRWAARHPQWPVTIWYNTSGPEHNMRYVCTYTFDGTITVAGDERRTKADAKESAAAHARGLLASWN